MKSFHSTHAPTPRRPPPPLTPRRSGPGPSNSLSVRTDVDPPASVPFAANTNRSSLSTPSPPRTVSA
ncbi:hypothetical protein C731_3264 [Mycolicibacterium hassiacum DSM 44199]|uniref:Uncharacterized protein n=1 Tax=Mycolicibacterium hassiacum (strain DSM 44199 / CIP 105218 / JCM 12690 / 3849) TaxID=1122247 RepID=K5B7Y3_MYCHD|nr:hypothetical protein C731_3264 [Mycolicibacterium hassiacum DSM 44199]